MAPKGAKPSDVNSNKIVERQTEPLGVPGDGPIGTEFGIDPIGPARLSGQIRGYGPFVVNFRSVTFDPVRPDIHEEGGIGPGAFAGPVFGKRWRLQSGADGRGLAGART